MIRKRLMIDANKVLERADEVTFMGFKAEERKRHFLELVSAILEQCSPVDSVEVAHGRWEVIEASDELYKCSVCGEWQYIPEEHFAYCPYCGAKMDGGNEDGI